MLAAGFARFPKCAVETIHGEQFVSGVAGLSAMQTALSFPHFLPYDFLHLRTRLEPTVLLAGQ